MRRSFFSLNGQSEFMAFLNKNSRLGKSTNGWITSLTVKVRKQPQWISCQDPVGHLISCARQTHSSLSWLSGGAQQLITSAKYDYQRLITCPGLHDFFRHSNISTSTHFRRSRFYLQTLFCTHNLSLKYQTNVPNLLRSLHCFVSLAGCTFHSIITGGLWVLG